MSAEPVGAILDGFTVTNGTTGTDELGGAMLIQNGSSPTISNCTFINNLASQGGAVYIRSGSKPAFQTCTFSSNSASSGGAVPLLNNSASGTKGDFINCTFSNNSSGGSGGAIQFTGITSAPTASAGVVLMSCTFQANSGQGNGGALQLVPTTSASGATPGAVFTITNSQFVNNTTFQNGGAIFMGRSAPASSISTCVFTSNTASMLGGAMSFANCSATVAACTLTGNQAGSGGALAVHNSQISHQSPIILGCQFLSNTANGIGGGISVDNSRPVVSSCTFEGNTGNGGGLYCERAAPQILNCLLRNNHSPNAFGGGGMLFGYYGGTDVQQGFYALVSNCVVVGNSTSGSGGGAGIAQPPSTPENGNHEAGQSSPIRISNTIVRDNTGANNIWFPTPNPPMFSFKNYPIPGRVIIQYCNIEGPIGGPYVGWGNIDADPMFVDATNGNYHLLPGSPCLDAGGDRWTVPASLSLDMDGNPRVLDADGDGVAWVDMGIDEFQGVAGPLGELPLPIAYWHFNSSLSGAADVGTGMLSTAAWGGSTLQAEGAFFDMNALHDTPPGNSLRLFNPPSGSGTYIEITLSMAGRQSLVATFATSVNNLAADWVGPNALMFDTGTWSYSTDGVNFTTLHDESDPPFVSPLNTCPQTARFNWHRMVADFSGPIASAALNNVPNVTLRYTLTALGGGDADEYVQIDNLQLNATPIPPTLVLGDADCDDDVDFDDVEPFVQTLLDPVAQQPCTLERTDMNADVAHDGLDVQGFVDALLP